MAYTIKNADGTVLLNLVDDTVDQKTTSLTLVGRNTDNYGTALNTNLVNMLQNFSNISPPRKPLVGQLWYSTSDGRLKVYTNERVFKEISAAIVSDTEPSTLKQGDLWIDSYRDQMFFTKDGNNLLLAGPLYSKQQGTSGMIPLTWLDSSLTPRNITGIYAGGTLVGIVSTGSFILASTSTQNSQGLFNVSVGITLNDTITNIRFQGTATNADSILNISALPYVPTTGAKNLTGGEVWINEDDPNGLVIGTQRDFYITSQQNGVISSDRITTINNTNPGAPLQILTTPEIGGAAIPRIYLDEGNVGIHTIYPSTPFHVVGDTTLQGNVTVTGNITVGGVQTILNTVILQVQDKNIELATSTTATFSDAQVDGGGITLKGTSNKEIMYVNTATAWSSNINWNLAPTRTYKIGYKDVITSTGLGAEITSTNITRVGVLNDLTVTNVLIAGSAVSNKESSFRITSVTSTATSTGSVITILLATPVATMYTGTTVRISGVVDPGYDNTYSVNTAGTTSFTVKALSTLTTTTPVLGATPTAYFPDLLLTSQTGDIDVTNKRVKNVQYSLVSTDAASVQFVLDSVSVQSLKGLALTVDTTNMVDVNLEIKILLDKVVPATNPSTAPYILDSQYDLPVGYRARILCQRHSITLPAQAVSVSSTSSLVMSYPSGLPVGALTAVNASNVLTTTTATITYSVKEFRVVNTPPYEWAYIRDI